MKIIAGTEEPDSGRVTKSGGTSVGILSQIDNAPKGATVRDVVLGDKATHEWARDAGVRAIFTGLFGGYHEELFTRGFASLSGGERRRVGLAKLLIEDLDLILLDEPTNHLDVEGVAWLAEHLKNRKNLAVVVVTHDRWFLDEVTDRTWEVVGGALEEYDGGYSAYVLAKAERARQQAAMDARRNNLLRKELAWLRRGAPARTSKPKFRVDAANELISAEPPPRDNTELLKFSQNRLGNTVFECQHLQIRAGENVLIEDLFWNIGPGQRIGIVGVNGAGKTTLMRTLAGEHFASAGKLVKGVTVKVAMLSQHLAELDPTWRLIEAVERVATRVELGGGRELSASQLCERLGFDRESQWTPVGDLSGGEKRRLQLTRLLMDSPNVLLLDEPTNDFDIEILTELEDLLDSFAGTLLVISHDRYFLERTCDQIVGLLGDGKVTDLPRGIDQYLEQRAIQIEASLPKANIEKKISSAAEERQNKKDLIRIERQMEKLDSEIKELEKAQEAAAFDAEALLKATEALQVAQAKREALEEEWLSKCV
jgi:ATP-binding cassette subfamily F protein uup